jgi:aryl-alcohol dehydrogenase-like predicted oxidoreductase
MKFNEPRVLGRTDLQVGRLGIASSHGAPAAAFEEAFERGCTYFVWNTFMKGRSKEMLTALRNIIKKGLRDRLVIAMHSYGHNAILNRYYLHRSLKTLGTDYIDVMLLGYYSWRPSQVVINGALKLKEMGSARYIGLTGHNRKLFPRLAEENIFDVFHVRYNAVHRGAESDIFPHLKPDTKPGIVAFTATSWGQLLSQKRMSEGVKAPTAADCYRFVLTNPDVDVVLTGPKTIDQMRENLDVIERGPLNEEEMKRMQRIGDYLYKKK